MQRIVAGIETIEQHLEAVKQPPEVYRPPCCPHCGLKILWRHGHYERKADRRVGQVSLNPVPICRYCCSGCQRTCSRLPACIAPRRWYDWSVQQDALKRRLNELPDSHGGHGHPADRRTAGRWWDWLQKKSLLFEFHLRARYAELGRATDFGAFWRRVFEFMGLAQAMTLLDQQMSVP